MPFNSEGSPTLGSRTPIQARILETNHERTLYVPYVFRNHLISRQRNGVLPEPSLKSVRPAAGGWRRAILLTLREQRVNGSQAPVPQRDFPTANCPDD